MNDGEMLSVRATLPALMLQSVSRLIDSNLGPRDESYCTFLLSSMCLGPAKAAMARRNSSPPEYPSRSLRSIVYFWVFSAMMFRAESLMLILH